MAQRRQQWSQTYTLGRPSAFGSAHKIWQHNRRYTRPQVQSYLQTTDDYTRFRRSAPVKYNRGTYARRPREHGQADLMSMMPFARYNANHSWVLCLVDTFSKFLWLRALKDKRTGTVIDGMRDIFRESGQFQRIVVDAGTEFTSQQFGQFMREVGTELTFASPHAVFAERAIGTVKPIIGRYLQRNEILRFYDVLQDVARTYNTRVHRAIQMSPADAEREENWRHVRVALDLYYREQENDRSKKVEFKPGTLVRLERDRNVFQRRAIYPSYTVDIYRVAEVIPHHRRNMYVVEDLNGNRVSKRFYAEQMVEVNLRQFKIRKVHRHRDRVGARGAREVLVEWSGLPASMASYVPLNKLNDYTREHRVGLTNLSRQRR